MSGQEAFPGRWVMAVHRAKVAGLRVRRRVLDTLAPVEVFAQGQTLAGEPVVSSSRTPLWSSVRAERHLEAGKVENLRVARAKLDGIEVPAGEIFSFWRHVGRPTRWAGFVEGREIREGCVMPAVAGGLCQLSNALYDAADRAGFEILERHRHTRVIPGSLAERGRDATVAWNYVDLRFAAPTSFRIEVDLSAEDLHVRLRAPERRKARLSVVEDRRAPEAGPSCHSCDEVECAQNREPTARRQAARVLGTAYLLDGVTPEFRDWVRRDVAADAGKSTAVTPFGDAPFVPGRYRWGLDGVDVYPVALASTHRTITSRRLAAQGAARQRALLVHERRIAEAMARRLTHRHTRIVVAQCLLPHLERLGALAGRDVVVLVDRLPLEALQARLDAAARANPKSPTLGDFRAPRELLELERRALLRCSLSITPHLDVARNLPGAVQAIPWERAAATSAESGSDAGPSIVRYPYPTLGRKGCHELARALEGLDVELWVDGPNLESRDVWRGLRWRQTPAQTDAVAVVAAPAWVEHRPTRLVDFALRGQPVVASEACGVPPSQRMHVIPLGDVDALRSMLRSLLTSSAARYVG